MTRSVARNKIAMAEENLVRAARLLLRMGPGVNECSTILEQTAVSLRSIRREGAFDSGDLAELKPSLQRLEQKMLLVQELLNSAVTFYCGWLSAGPLAAGGYSPGAGSNPVAARGALSIEA